MLAGQEAVDVDGTGGQDDHPAALLKEGSEETVGTNDVDEAKDVAEHEVSNTEVDGKQDVFLDGTGGSVEGDVSVVHSKGVSPEVGEGDVVVGPCIEACER